MIGKRVPGTRSEVIRCANCGEDYSVTYKRCPFCDERSRAVEEYEGPPTDYDELEDEEEIGRAKGKRMAGGRRGGGYGGHSPVRLAMTVLSLGIIVAAVWIVFNWVAPLVANGKLDPTPPPVATLPASAAVTKTPASPAVSGQVTPSPAVSGQVTPSPAVSGQVTPSPVITTTPPPAASPSTAPVTSKTPIGSGKSFTLNRADFTMEKAGETFVMKASGASGTVTWASKDPKVATVDASGKVTAVGKGDTTITATAGDGAVAECIVRCRGGAAATEPQAPASSVAPAVAAKLNRQDFTLGSKGESFTMKVTGATGTPVWNIGDTNVATIDGSGKVTAVAKGSTTVTCTVDGQTLKCIVRCTF